MKNLVLSILFFLSIRITFAQEIIIKAANSNGKAALFSLSGENISFIDSIPEFNNNTFQFKLNNNHPGFYRLTFNNKKWVDFIYDNENVKIETDVDNISNDIKISESESNKIYYDFIKLNKDYKTKTELLQLILARYPKDDNYFQTSREKLIRVQEEYLYFVNVTAGANPNSFIARYIKSSQLPVIGPEIEVDKQLAYLKTHALDNINFNDDELVYSDVFTNRTIEYLSYYRNPQLPLGLLEKEFESAIDSILSKAKVNDIVYKHIVEYLLDGFKKFGFDNVINYIVDNYVIKDEICLDEKLSNTLERRINQNKYFKIGNVAPDFSLYDLSGSEIKLSKINSEKSLIIFYASWCPHCKILLPQIFELYKKQDVKNIEVVAISIDTLKSEWQNFVNINNLTWINVSDLNGWNGNAALDYYLYATPTMFLD